MCEGVDWVELRQRFDQHWHQWLRRVPLATDAEHRRSVPREARQRMSCAWKSHRQASGVVVTGYREGANSIEAVPMSRGVRFTGSGESSEDRGDFEVHFARRCRFTGASLALTLRWCGRTSSVAVGETSTPARRTAQR